MDVITRFRLVGGEEGAASRELLRSVRLELGPQTERPSHWRSKCPPDLSWVEPRAPFLQIKLLYRLRSAVWARRSCECR